MPRSPVLFACALLIVAGGGTACASPREAGPARLKADLEKVQAAPADKPFDAGANVDPSVLVGLSRKDIRRSLGGPVACPERKLSRREYTCEAYDFFKLPARWAGGGTVLQVVYDGYDLCVRAYWLATM